MENNLISNADSVFEFLTKRELIERLKDEKIILTSDSENKLKNFNENNVLSIEMSVNSPAKVINVDLFDVSIVDFINDVSEKDGIKKEVMNNTFKELNNN